MATRKTIRSKQLSNDALELEKSGDYGGAVKLYQKAASADPLNIQAWNRQMVVYRKTKSRQEEIALIKSAIDAYTKQTEIEQQAWLVENREKADSTRELAKVLGLLEDNGMPTAENDILEKWKTRLYLLEYRLKNARKKTKNATIKPTPAKKALVKPKPTETKSNAKTRKAKQPAQPKKQPKKAKS